MSSSLVSFAKKEIYEVIPGMQCATYRIQPCEDKVPSILIVRDSFYYKPDIDGNNDMVAVTSAQIAESIVNMHNTSQLGYSPTTYPAFFCIPDWEVTVDDLVNRFKDECKRTLDAQRNWYSALVRMADDDWTALPRHNMVSSIQRTAAKELGLNRPWLLQIEEETGIPDCPFCGKDLLSPTAPVCPTCGRVINPKRVAEIEAMMAKMSAKETVKA